MNVQSLTGGAIGVSAPHARTKPVLCETAAILTLALLWMACATPQPLSDVLVHTSGSRLEGDLGEGRHVALLGQANSISRTAIMSLVDEQIREDPQDSFFWLRSGAAGAAIGASAHVIPDRLAIGATLGWLMAGADITLRAPLDTYLTLTYGWRTQGSFLVQRRLWSHPNASVAAGAFYRRDMQHILAAYIDGDPDPPERERESIYCIFSYPDRDELTLNVLGGRVSSVLFAPLSDEQSAHLRFTLEAGYSPNLDGWIGSGGVSFWMP